ncbi:MAG: hypothetical protein K8R48_05950 [Alphaproteobacteria bacterium]|nr:hypothetical protein [Alphaproteobacteria bacterium]
MSILPAFKATLDNSLSAKECDDVVKQIKKINGVISVAFNAASNPKQILVTYHVALHTNAEDKVRKMAGVTKIEPML